MDVFRISSSIILRQKKYYQENFIASIFSKTAKIMLKKIIFANYPDLFYSSLENLCFKFI